MRTQLQAVQDGPRQSLVGPVYLSFGGKIYDLRDVAKRVWASFEHFALWSGFFLITFNLIRWVAR